MWSSCRKNPEERFPQRNRNTGVLVINKHTRVRLRGGRLYEKGRFGERGTSTRGDKKGEETRRGKFPKMGHRAKRVNQGIRKGNYASWAGER